MLAKLPAYLSFTLFILCSFRAFFAHAAALPPHPRLLLNSNGITLLKERIARSPWAKESWAELRGRADRALPAEISLPPRGGNWSHNYVCPTHGARLNEGKRIGPWQWEHICPVGHHVLKGDPSKASLDFDGNAISGIHFNLAQQSVNDGLVYQVTGDQRYARKAREILLAYAARYLSYPLHDNQGKPGSGGHIASQSLTEASWLIEIAQGADLVWSTLSETDRKTIEEKVLRPALTEVILPRRLGIHNIQCRHNSAIGLVGFLIGDDKLITTAIDDPSTGFRAQLEKGVRDDGMWLEGSSGYHFFTIAGLWPLAEAARNCGMDLYTPRFQNMFDGPLALAMPDLVLPNFNDSGTVPLENQADVYELAFARFHSAAYVPLLAKSSRSGRLALLIGSASLSPANNGSGAGVSPAAPGVSASSSRNLPSSGYAILQRGTGRDATWLCLKYGPHGGGHGHPDKNTFILYSRGQIIATDAGTHAYGSPLHRDWDKTTLAHNTLVVDETSQEPATGKCIAFGSGHGIDYAITDAGTAYKDVSFTRTAALINSNLVVFVDQISASSPHTYDLAYHQIGEWDEVSNKASSFAAWQCPAHPGYNRLTDTTSRVINRPLVLRATSGRVHPSIFVFPTESTEIITGYGLLKTTDDLVPAMLQRRKSKNTAFIWSISLDGSPVELKDAPLNNASGSPVPHAQAVLLHVKQGSAESFLLVNPHRASLEPKLPDGSIWRTSEAFAVR